MQKHCSIQILGIKRLLKATLKGIPLPMRLLIIMLCVSIGCIRATNTYAQNAILDLKVNNQTIETVLKIIESRTDFVFFFNSQQVNVHKRVSINVNKQNIFKILDEVFKGSDVVYSVLDKSIILSSKRFAPDGNLKKITGKVVDTNGEPLIGVTIALKGSNRGTVSDVNGNFSLNGEEGKLNVLNISYIGYKDQQVKVEDGKTLIITLEEDTKVLEEVVVVGYGTQKKINLTGAVAVVDDKQVIGRSADNLSKLLQGAVPNMNVTVSNGRPGQGGSINIRGINSISSSATPLILVDGVEGTIDAVNPNDVESISVLKDASSAAVYGARAAYGVILVTTKSGNDGKTRVSYNGRYSFGSPTVSRDFETRGYYSAAINDMFYSTYQGSNYTNYNDEDYYGETDDSKKPNYTEVSYNGNKIFIPRCIKDDVIDNVDKSFDASWFTSSNGHDLFSYGASASIKQDTAFAEYRHSKTSNAFSFMKKCGKEMAERYLDEKNQEKFVDFLKTGAVERKYLPDLLKQANQKEKTAAAAYIMQSLGQIPDDEEDGTFNL